PRTREPMHVTIPTKPISSRGSVGSVGRTRENAQDKARRYLTEGRLHVLLVHGDRIFAECRGNGAIWHPVYVRRAWHCDCPAGNARDCAHLNALRLVTTEPKHRNRKEDQ